MERFIAVDSGKFATKVACYDKTLDETKIFRFRTRTGEGSFEDDALENNTYIVEIDGKTYKVGNGAKREAELNTSKASEEHKICTLTAIAMLVGDKVDDVNVAIGIPVKEWEIVEKRNEYKNYILPEGEITVLLKTGSDTPPQKKTFRIKNRYVFPESIGPLYLDNMEDYMDNTAAVIDIGNLNINCTLWNNFELDKEYSLTGELGGNILISGLATELSAEFGRVNETLVAKKLLLPKEERFLIPTNNKNSDIPQRSKQVIDRYMLEHTRKIRRCCDSKQWSLDFMKLIFIGGTSEVLRNEIYEIFGENVYIPEHPEYANVLGFLRLLGAKTLNELIPLPKKKNEVVEVEKSA